MEPDWNLIFQFLVGPGIVGLVVLAGQYFIQPWIAERSTQKTERARQKRDAYIQTIGLVDQQLNAQTELYKFWPNHKPTGSPVPPAIVNNAVAALFLLADDQEIPALFTEFFGRTLSGDALVRRALLIDKMRKELYGAKLLIEVEKVPFYLNES